MRERKIEYVIIIILIGLISFYLLIYSFLPESISIVKDNKSNLDIKIPFKLYIKSSEQKCESVLKINGNLVSKELIKYDPDKSITVSSNEIGEYFLDIKLFGFLPLKTVKVSVIPEIKVYPGGQAIGVLLKSNGIIVVESSFVEGADGHRYFPGQKAGIEVGDRIIEINGNPVNDKYKLLSYIQKYRKSNQIYLKIVKKNGDIKEINLSPVKSRNGDYMIGLYVDDGVAGVGTLTFYDESSNDYAALGHLITESTAGIEIELRTGHIVEANISGITGGVNGVPGEKLGTFFQTKDILGNIKSNNNFGIYGKLIKTPSINNSYFDKPLPVAVRSSVQSGPAHMYTVIEGDKIEEFDVYIEKVYRQHSPAAKSMIIKITDPELNKLTGGIVQGMSGSPLVQNNMLIGAVTHVFINNPQRGYGVFAEWMIKNTNNYRDNILTKKAG